MLFASFDFLLFLPLALAGYWALGRFPRARALFLLLASYFFYAATPKTANGPLPAPWHFSGLLLLSTALNYGAALRVEAAKRRFGDGRFWMLASTAANLALLGYFKYTGFLFECATLLAGTLGLPQAAPSFHLALPLGISFYTFQNVGYVVDVYRGTVPAERSFLRYALYVAFFPQLIAGPIVRASELLPALGQRLRVEAADVDEAVFRITRGLVKKLLFADLLAASFVDIVLGSPASYSTLENLLALYAFTLQIYADFSGYSDMAIGVARLFGFRLPENFDRPYQAASLGEFWRRWHMTLSGWLRDYVFVPLGGSRGGTLRVYFNVWLTLFLVGMWHGASWNFVAYSSLQAFAMVFDRFVRKRDPSLGARVMPTLGFALSYGLLVYGAGHLLGLGDVAGIASAIVVGHVSLFGILPSAEEAPWTKSLHVLSTFHFVVLSRLFFRAETLDTARELCRKLLDPDTAGVRPGLLRIHAVHDAVASATTVPEPIRSAALTVCDNAVLLLLAVGFSLHFLPARACNRAGLAFVAKLPAWGIAGLLGLLCAALPFLLSAPRPNIYFSF
ncbi:MAG TPA: MBOAT family O-acyltransferase [Polyangiaceae bacterium]